MVVHMTEIIKQNLISELRKSVTFLYETDDPNALEKIYLGCYGCPELYECADVFHCHFRRDKEKTLPIYFKFTAYLSAIRSVLDIMPHPGIFVDVGSRPGLSACCYLMTLNDTVIFKKCDQSWRFRAFYIDDLKERLYNDFYLIKTNVKQYYNNR